MKICTKCKLEKEESEFYKFRSSMCKCCVRIENKIAQLKYRKSDKGKCTIGKYRESDKFKAYLERLYKTDKYKAYLEKIYKKHRESEEYKRKRGEYRRNRYRNDVQYKLACRISGRLRMALQRNYRAGLAVNNLGCSIFFLKRHLEEQFQIGMSWSNWGVGNGKWHIDHKYPFSKVDLTDREQLLRVCHYTNLQPLWAEENLKKGNRIIS